MKRISELNRHCGECDVIDWCGNAYCYCLCHDQRFGDMYEDEYRRIAGTVEVVDTLPVCGECRRRDCDVYKFSDEDYMDEECDHWDESKDYYCEQVADAVAARIERMENEQG